MKDNSGISGNKDSGRFIKIVLIAAGTISLGIGIIGIVLPLLPTTPFLLLTAACYARSSVRFYNWLLNNKMFGNFIRNYREGKGIPVRVKVLSISLLWLAIMYSCFAVSDLIVRIVLILIAIGVTIHILSVKAKKREIQKK